MRILHYLLGLPPVREGGLIGYALDLASEQMQQGNETYLLVPGKYKDGYETKIMKKKWNEFDCFCINNPLPVTGGRAVTDISVLYAEGNVQVYMDFLRQLAPDIVHIHSFMGLHKAFMQAANEMNITMIFTSHDYYGLCPKATLFKNDMSICNGNWNLCSRCMGQGIAVKQIVKQQSPVYGYLKANPIYHWMEYSPSFLPIKNSIQKKSIQKNADELFGVWTKENDKEYRKLKEYYNQMFRYVNFFHFNSIQAETVYRRQLGNIQGEVVYISNNNIKDKRRIGHYGRILKLGFVAYSTPNKGFGILKDALDEMYSEGMTDIECHIFHNYRDEAPSYMVRHTPYKHHEIENAFAYFDVLVLPSLWKETFGLVALEAISLGKPVIMTENVGAKELLLGNNIGIVVKPDKESLKKKLIELYNDKGILEIESKKIKTADIKFDFKEHCCKITGLYEKASVLAGLSDAAG